LWYTILNRRPSADEPAFAAGAYFSGGVLMKIHESAENYLETILVLSKKKQVRAIDICNELGFAKPTVSIAMKQFRQNGYVATDENGFITLTEKGRVIAERTYERHRFFGGMLVSIGVSPEVAYQDACKLEHDISEESFERLKEHFRRCPIGFGAFMDEADGDACD
jgi:DtxR family Mn-dependent transcriptional regulator